MVVVIVVVMIIKKQYDDDLKLHIHSKLLVNEERLKNIEEDVKEIKLIILEKKK